MAAQSLIMAACGAAGALTYSFPIYLKNVSKNPPVRFALANCLFSVGVGSIFAAIFTQVIGHQFKWTVDPEPWPLALVVGLCSNPLIPIFVRKMEKWAETFEGKAR